jgi:hypothetical protein
MPDRTRGCCCPEAGVGPLCFHVGGCTANLAGVEITLTDGAGYTEIKTTPSGPLDDPLDLRLACFTPPAAGTYTYTIKKYRYDDYTSTYYWDGSETTSALQFPIGVDFFTSADFCCCKCADVEGDPIPIYKEYDVSTPWGGGVMTRFGSGCINRQWANGNGGHASLEECTFIKAYVYFGFSHLVRTLVDGQWRCSVKATRIPDIVDGGGTIQWQLGPPGWGLGPEFTGRTCFPAYAVAPVTLANNNGIFYPDLGVTCDVLEVDWSGVEFGNVVISE